MPHHDILLPLSRSDLTVACVKWGPWCAPHGADYVNRLFNSVGRHLALPHRFVCFTDDASGLREGIEARPLPENLKGRWWSGPYANRDLRHFQGLMAMPYLLQRPFDHRCLLQDDIKKSRRPINLVGWWNKIYLFKSGALEGRVLYFDLDTAITGDLTPLGSYGGEFAILRDFNRPQNFGSGVMMWDASKCGDIWEDFVRAGCPNLRRGDQVWIQKCRPNADLLQDLYPSVFVSYKCHCGAGLPADARVVCFHGSPRPHEVADGWMKEHWH